MDKPFKFVIVGTGKISDAYVASINSLPGIELAGVVSRTGRRPSSLSPKANIPVAANLASLQVPFDAVILATPNGLHHATAIEAAELGKHVLSEKVLDISLDACDRIIESCENNKVTLGVAYQRRANPVNRRIKMLIEQGGLGRIFAADVKAKLYRGQEYYDSATYRGSRLIDGGGVFIQQAAHDLDLLIWFFGQPDKLASLYGTFLHEMESEDHGAVLMGFGGEMIATLIASTCSIPEEPATMTLHSDRGTLCLSGDRITQMHVEGLTPAAIESLPIDEMLPGHEGVLSDFVRAVQNHCAPLVSGREARKSVELILKIYNSKL